MFSVKIVLLFSAIAATVFAGETREGRQFLPADITGKYEIFVKQGSCARNVNIKSFSKVGSGAYSVPHVDIIEDGVACTDEGAFTIITKEAIVESGNEVILESPLLANVVNTLESQGATFMLGFEKDPRVCGSDGTAANTIAIFVEEEKKIDIPGLITLFPGAKYMIVYEPDSLPPCTYFAKAPDRVIGVPVAQPTVTPEPSEEVVEASAEAGSSEEDKEVTIPGAAVAGTVAGAATGAAAGAAASGTDEFSDTGATIVDVEEEGSPEPSSEDDDDGSVCFPADATVETEDGLTKRMDEIEIGERVKVGSNEYSEVFMFTHKMSQIEYSFVELVTENSALSLTKGHYLYVNGVLATAESVQVGDQVDMGSGSSMITKISTVRGKGLYNPQTIHGDIMVNGVRASTYTTAVEKNTAHSLLAPIRAAFRSFGITTCGLEKGSDRLANLMPSGGMTA